MNGHLADRTALRATLQHAAALQLWRAYMVASQRWLRAHARLGFGARDPSPAAERYLARLEGVSGKARDEHDRGLARVRKILAGERTRGRFYCGPDCTGLEVRHALAACRAQYAPVLAEIRTRRATGEVIPLGEWDRLMDARDRELAAEHARHDREPRTLAPRVRS